MKSFKNILRLWISFTSIFGFFGAWAMLAQSFKPKQPAQLLPATAYPTLAALAPISTNSAVQPNIALQVVTPTPLPFSTPQPQPVYAPPLLRAGGS
jgi:hypothetical protein